MSKNFEKCIKLMVETDFKVSEIAEELKVSERTIYNWKKRDDFNELKEKYQKEYLANLTAPAIRTLQGLLNAKSELVRFQAATDILDRTGYKPTDKQEISIDEPIVLANSWVQDNGS
ncbi:phBC6A51 family helix-turn-helix protein [Streptococcus dysgalactiae subsp. equisimilis]|uniref:Phage protein n=2 Tax=Streptococcus dysgalactiae TaxID=1334 RepID=A0A380JU33_STRDY|nr:helix-turn-helix domain-containing protein [Streptococcus dysgalactiae]MCL6222246.1 phBC6A51 family helix-turn-helix protein [Streptococcus dysgalactiae subsp. equisimilis]UMY67878.1 phBC6A51 family helix-turn-helix protein [Streptococcus dysgalactiae subsp. equisimilis]SQF66333.1 phage protein [Streptococcus dysgalactiae subsp. equisimilis]SUN47739.1 phage protein [Streptococcus dysgalactiae subsp. dysgalactiae]VEF04357.1 phage protein [Streptococcus dysgalactiae subsp. equisimilis]